MPQKIQMGNPREDLIKLNNLVNTMVSYGMIHEEAEISIADTMLLWSSKQDELTESIRKEMDDEDVEETDIIDYITDNYGTYHFHDMILNETTIEMKTKAALIFRHIIQNVLAQDMYKSPEEILDECETWLAEDAESDED